jgi:NitT/TauT family transport system substrate-binding protein
MRRRRMGGGWFAGIPVAVVLLLLAASACRREPDAGPPGGEAPPGRIVLRFGHFPNITHVQALVAHRLTRQGKGWFEERLGPGVEVRWFVYNAGPTAMEAILTGSLDLAYVGPNPALNAHVKSRGEEIRILAGAANGGSALVVQGDGRIRKPADFRGRRVATPQLGSTQDVACRAWLKEQGFKITQLGGDVQVIPTSNPDQLALFQRGHVDGVWTVEPWVSRLEIEAGGKVYLEEPDAVATVLVSSTKLLGANRPLVDKVVAAHAELTAWIQENPAEAQRMVLDELEALTTRGMPAALLESSWRRIRLTTEVRREAFEEFVAAAQEAGFLPGQVDISRLLVKP